MSRLIIFAGPNGSGKSTITRKIQRDIDIGIYLNADDIEQHLHKNNVFDCENYQVKVQEKDLRNFVRNNTILQTICQYYNCFEEEFISTIVVKNNIVRFGSQYKISSYLSMIIVDYLRHYYLKNETSFCFETVMSHSSKLEIMQNAKNQGFEVILYFVTTESPLINVNRVKNRYAQGGHFVEEEKIVSRYNRSSDLLYDALKLVDLAYLFDNSSDGQNEELPCFATVFHGKEIELTSDLVPRWFNKFVIQKMNV
ncbi:MAG: zeta toxin family protein [Arcicella sp.]|nr:zeta toxin family protein [Arcicella sp.]